jgi:hypothetical protein
MTLDEIVKMLDGAATVTLWPEAGRALGLTRGQPYRCAGTGEIQTLEFGRTKRVTSSWLRRKLGLDQTGQGLSHPKVVDHDAP